MGLLSFDNRKDMFFVYAIQSTIAKRIYVGMSSDVEGRVLEHNSGKTQSTKGYKPWTLFYKEEFETRIAARIREKYLKSGCGKEFLKEYKLLHNI